MTQNLATNQSRLEDITMQDDVPTSFQMDEGFGGGLMGFGKEVDQFSAGDLENMFFTADNRSETPNLFMLLLFQSVLVSLCFKGLSTVTRRVDINLGSSKTRGSVSQLQECGSPRNGGSNTEDFVIPGSPRPY